jgi:ribonucleoside-diphosphate reductase alpha chain
MGLSRVDHPVVVDGTTEGATHGFLPNRPLEQTTTIYSGTIAQSKRVIHNILCQGLDLALGSLLNHSAVSFVVVPLAESPPRLSATALGRKQGPVGGRKEVTNVAKTRDALSVEQGQKRRGLQVRRRFTTGDADPYDELTWERRDAVITNWRDGSIAFEQRDLEFPATWSQNATNIVAQKYFRGPLGTPQREHSVRQMVDRVAGTIASWGLKDGYFASQADGEAFRSELTHLLVNQRAAFNSPVWFNVGVEPEPQCSACFILSVEDTMPSILNWYVEEGLIFKGGSGSGINLSTIRSSKEPLGNGGEASGPVSFMRGADASAGTIKSGGKTRRAAKMVVLNVDHPDVRDFIWCKAREEHKARALRDAGFDMDLDGRDSISIQYQNANNSVRVTDDFMRAYERDAEFDLEAVLDGQPVEQTRARELMREIAQAAWECADPGMQYDTVINSWHTTPESGRINASNPCSEYMHLDNSACNLASLNLLKFLGQDGVLDVEAFKHAVEVVFLAQEIIVGNSSYPTERITRNANDYRQLGLGYANLGALLMAQGKSYDSDGGRAWAAAITALMTGHAYRTSARIAQVQGPFAGYAKNRAPMLRVIGKHRKAVDDIDASLVQPSLLEGARTAWDEALQFGEEHGFRNAQASVLAPTGTIGLLMDCDTTGIEPDLALVKTKKLVGGGSMSIVNQTVPRALRQLGYAEEHVQAILEYIAEQNSVKGAPALRAEHYPVFDCAMGDSPIQYMGHIRMMAAVQPFISGAISKTVNMPESVSVEEVERAYYEGWRLGLKALAIYRDNCKVGQPLSATKSSKSPALVNGTGVTAGQGDRRIVADTGAVIEVQDAPVRRRLPRTRPSKTTSFRVGDIEGYLTASSYPDDGLGEIFVKVSKQGSTLSGVMDAFAIAVSVGLQYGVPLEVFVAKFSNVIFEPNGMTDDPDIRIAQSLVDYIARRLAIDYLDVESRQALGVKTTAERIEDVNGPSAKVAATSQPAQEATGSGPAVGSSGAEAATDGRLVVEGGDEDPPTVAPASPRGEIVFTPGMSAVDAPFCSTCGVRMRPAGSCFVCESCGTTSGCS